MIRWLLGQRERAVYITPWNDWIAAKHMANTEHLLLGWCGPVQAAPTAAQRSSSAHGGH
jgi:hypothetical protein